MARAEVRGAARGVSANGHELVLPIPAEWIERAAQRAAEIVAARVEPAPVDPWLTVAEAAEHMRTTPRRINDLTYLHKLTPDGYDGRKPMFRRSTLDAYLTGP